MSDLDIVLLVWAVAATIWGVVEWVRANSLENKVAEKATRLVDWHLRALDAEARAEHWEAVACGELLPDNGSGSPMGDLLQERWT